MTASQQNPKTIGWKELEIGEFIANGGYGDVYQGKWQGRVVAIKQLHIKKLPEDLEKDFFRETKFMIECQSERIVQLFGVCVEMGHNAMVMELMTKGSLRNILQKDSVDLPWVPTRVQIAVDIGLGLAYLHDKEIIHRDLKSLNILIDAHLRAKISDFGLAKLKLESKSSASLVKQSVGTSRWKAPELFKRGVSHSKGSDVYSYGMIMWEIASRKLPYSDSDDEQTVISWIKEGELETLQEEWPADYNKLIKLAWAKESERRPSAKYIADELSKLLPQALSLPIERSWHFGREIKLAAPSTSKKYELVPASPSDLEKVLKFYAFAPVPGYEVASVKVIYNPSFNRSFELHMSKLQERSSVSAFEPKWSWDDKPEWRAKVHELFLSMSKPYTDPDYPDVKLLPLWHGTRPEIIDSICRVGFASLAGTQAETDPGFFGKGLYSTFEAEYAHRVYSKGALLLNWVAIYSAYPTIDGDMGKLATKANFQNYDAHFVPVVPKDPTSLRETNYYPTKPGQKHTYTEIVVFESAACLPRYLVELQPIIIKAPNEASQIQAKSTVRLLPSTPSTSSIKRADSPKIGLRVAPEKVGAGDALKQAPGSLMPHSQIKCNQTIKIDTEVGTLAILPNGNLVISVASKKDPQWMSDPWFIKIWDPKTGKIIRTLNKTFTAITLLKALPNGQVLICDENAYDGPGDLFILDLFTEEVVTSFAYAHHRHISTTALLSDGKFATIAVDCIWIRDIAKGDVEYELKTKESGATGGTILEFLEKDFLASNSWSDGNVIHIWNLKLEKFYLHWIRKQHGR